MFMKKTTSSNASLIGDKYNAAMLYMEGKKNILRQLQPFADKSDAYLDRLLRRAFVYLSDTDQLAYIKEAESLVNNESGKPNIESNIEESRHRNSMGAALLYKSDVFHILRYDEAFPKMDRRELYTIIWNGWKTLDQAGKDVYNRVYLKSCKTKTVENQNVAMTQQTPTLKKIPTPFACYVHLVRPLFLRIPEFAVLEKSVQYALLKVGWDTAAPAFQNICIEKQKRVQARCEQKHPEVAKMLAQKN